jgi:hypothetical protein
MIEEPLTEPIPGAIDRLGAGLPETVQERVEEPVLVIVGGVAVNAEMEGATAWLNVVALAEEDCAETFVAASTAATV